MKYEAGEYYARITQQFKRTDGTPSYYDMLSGNGQFTIRVRGKVVEHLTQSRVKEIVHEHLKGHVHELDSYQVLESDYGWTYERFVRMDGDDVDTYEIVSEGEHTDHEVFDVYVFYIFEDVDAFHELEP